MKVRFSSGVILRVFAYLPVEISKSAREHHAYTVANKLDDVGTQLRQVGVSSKLSSSVKVYLFCKNYKEFGDLSSS